LTDADLLRGARSGDAEAWRTLYDRYLPAVWRQAYARVSDIHAAEDITSETMLALLRGINHLETDAPQIAAWLRTVVERKSADHYRKKFRTNGQASQTMPVSEEPSDLSRPGASLESDETRAQVMAILGMLPPRQRTVLEWKYLDEFRVREMAERLGETEKAVEALLYRARREFRRLFDLKQLARNDCVVDEPTGIDSRRQ
jgi:RNA polymerase sigma-70 factor (ECF subfamily)